MGGSMAIALIIAAAVGASVYVAPGEEKTLTASTLTKAIDIAELSTAQYTYNGIAELYKDEEKKKVECYIQYKATVKASIDMKAVEWDIDEDALTARPILPPITVHAYLSDEQSLSFLPSNADIELKDALTACKQDAEQEAMQSEELLDAAEQNLKSIIEALTHPIVEDKGYQLVWD